MQYLVTTNTDFTDKKRKKIFLSYKEIQKGSVANSYMTKGLLMHA